MNPQAPAPAGPAPAPPVNDATAMAGIIDTLGPAPAPSNVIDFGSGGPEIIEQPQPTPYQPQQPYLPGAPQPAPAPPAPSMFPQQQPAPAPAPQYPPQPQYQPAPVPQATPAPPQPTPFDPAAIPLPTAPPVMPQPQPAPQAPAPAAADQPPAWAAGLIADVQALKSNPGAGSEWKPDNWADVDARIEARARQLVTEGVGQVQAAQQAQAEQAQQVAIQADQARQAADSYIDNQITTLEQTGYLPPVANPADPNDQGKAARQELYAYAIALGTDNLTAVAPTLYAHHQAGYYFDRTSSKLIRRGSQTAAAHAPIAGSAPNFATAPGAPPTGPSMRDLATMDFSAISDMANRAIPLGGAPQ